MKLTQEEKGMLIDACLAEINSLNQYKNNKFVNTQDIEKHQNKLLDLINKLGE